MKNSSCGFGEGGVSEGKEGNGLWKNEVFLILCLFICRLFHIIIGTVCGTIVK